MNSRLFFWALTSALAGFLFGFDTVVISGAEQAIEKLWELSPTQHGLAIGFALWGMVVGSLVGGWPTDHWGRKKTLLCFGIPESPRWLIGTKGDREAGLEVLRLINSDASEAEVQALADEIAKASGENTTARGFWAANLKTPILLAFLIGFFNQLSGINAVLYFAPRIFEMTGLGEKAALLQSVGIGVTNLLFTFVGLWLIDRLGRRTLLYVGSLGYIFSLGLCSWAFFTENFDIVPACIFAFIASHAVGQGAVIWVFISEIFPQQYRAAGASLGCFTHWIFAALLTTFFPMIVNRFAPGYVFLFFCGMMVLQLIWVKAMVPETKGVPLEEMQQKLGIE